jgi:hypothetical protein
MKAIPAKTGISPVTAIFITENEPRSSIFAAPAILLHAAIQSAYIDNWTLHLS